MKGPLGKVHWIHRCGGLSIPDTAAYSLEQKWSDHLHRLGLRRPEC
jgi:hypothetical protein